MSDNHKDDSPLTDELIEFAAKHPMWMPDDNEINQWQAFIERKIPDMDRKVLTFRKIIKLAKIGNRRLRRLRKAGDAVLAKRIRQFADTLDGGNRSGAE